MTVFLFAAGGVLAGLGTRVSALLFVGGAVLGARQPVSFLAAVSTWTAATAAGWVLVGRGSPRSIAVPSLGAAAVLAAAGAPNGAVVLGLWVLATVSVVLGRGASPAGRRWAIGLAAGDVVFAVAVATTAGRGFEGWPFTLEAPGAIAMLIAAVLRTPLAGGSPDAPAGSYAANLVVRAQSVVLVGLAVSAAERPVATAVVALGVLAFAAGPLAARRATVDAVQELGLVALTLGGASLGWISTGWVWAALASGTLIHLVRSALGSRPSGAFADVIGRGVGIGLPFLPVCAAVLDGALRASSRWPIILMLGVIAGIAGRSTLPAIAVTREPTLDRARAWGPVVVAGAASIAAPLLWSPSPPAGGGVPWPPLWAAGVVGVTALVGARLHTLGTATTEPRTGRPVLAQIVSDRLASVDPLATDVVLWAGITAVAAAAVVLWLVGLGRGFL